MGGWHKRTLAPVGGYDKGLFFVLAGENAGEIVPYDERTGGAGLAAGGGLEIGRIDFTGPKHEFKKQMLFGLRTKYFVSYNAGVSFTTSTVGQYSVYSTALTLGLSISPFGGFLDGGFNHGDIYPAD